MFPKITAALTIQDGLMAHTRQSLKVGSFVESVIMNIGQTTAVTGVTILESGIVELSSCMSYKSRWLASFVIVVPAAQVSCLVCFFECQSTMSHQVIIIINHQTKFKTFSKGGSVPS